MTDAPEFFPFYKKMTRFWTLEKRHELERLLKERVSLREVSRRLGTSRSVVYREIEPFERREDYCAVTANKWVDGVGPGGAYRVFSKEEEDFIRSSIGDGVGVKKISRSLKCGCDTVARWARKNVEEYGISPTYLKKRIDGLEEQIKLLWEVIEGKNGN
ncbi:helix-turn-helix domain-containing protein [bacterium]|nr:helix-turn-helix domain-containing protein [bacterium]